MFKILVSVVFVVSLVVAASAQKVLDKEIDKWSKKDALEILNDSPWAKLHQSIQGAANASASEALRAQSDNRLAGAERGSSARVGAPPPVIIRLYSGLPIRLALTRLNQIGSDYDKMNDEGKAKFNSEGKKMLDCAICQNYYVVTMMQVPNPSGQTVEEAIFQGMTNEQMKGNIWLKNDKGEIRELAQFLPPQKRGDSATFFFPRLNDKGELLLTKDNSDLSVVFNGNFLTANNRFAYLLPRQFDFKVSKITRGDMVVF